MIKTIFLISDFLFPLWLIALIIILKRKGISAWKAWSIASTVCLIQAYLVAKLIGWNLGGYLIVFISSIPSILFGKENISEGVTSILFWIMPPIVLIVIPALILFLSSKAKKT